MLQMLRGLCSSRGQSGPLKSSADCAPQKYWVPAWLVQTFVHKRILHLIWNNKFEGFSILSCFFCIRSGPIACLMAARVHTGVEAELLSQAGRKGGRLRQISYKTP